ncbi:MAG TPA: membrane protein insertase YidC [Myxococcales bacterium]|nr:membrane protein insertase YidC [Myxococcales bacterium]
MDRNLLLAFALSMAVFSGWLAWQEEIRGPERRAAAERARISAEVATAEETEGSETYSFDTERANPISERVRKDRSPEAIEESEARGSLFGAEDSPVVDVWSGLLESEFARVELSSRGGVLTGWRIKNYYETPRDELHVELIDLPKGAGGALSTPFESLGLGDLEEAVYEVEDADANEVVFLLRRGGIEIRKTYRRPSDSYTMGLTIEIRNASHSSIEPDIALLIPAAANERPDYKEVSLVALANDEVERELLASVGSGGFLGGLFGGDDGPYSASSGVQWGGMDLRYFAGVVIPEDPEATAVEFLPIEKGKWAATQLTSRLPRLAPGESESHSYTIFFGPKEPALLKEAGYDLGLTISQGWSWVAPLTAFFGWALKMVYGVVPNYGLAIIVLTILVRLATWPIMARQMKSSERMRELMPRIKVLQEKFKDDKQKQSEETFKLYRETGVNPLGGCLPMVLQLPVFIGLFYALQSSIDLRHAPFMLWINDLSAPATLFTLPGMDLPVRILPILMAASMFGQQKMMPQTGMDPAQARMMLIMMPGMMLFISYTFPSGLVLYWLVSNMLGIGHQLLVRQRMQAAAVEAG